MPYYRWRGVTLDAAYCNGVLFAHSPESLDEMLFKQEIALISYKPVVHIYVMPISHTHKQFFFEHLQALLNAGVHVWQALNIISEQVNDGRFADIIFHISLRVQQGDALHEALNYYPHVFSDHMMHVIKIGTQADNLPIALDALCQYMHETHVFQKRLRSVLLLPVFTLLVFVTIISVILFAIVPRYVELFSSMGKDLPAATRMLMQANEFASSYAMPILLFSVVVLGVFAWWLLRIPSIKKMWDYWVLKVAYLGNLSLKVAMVHFLRSLALLLKGGMPLVPALQIAQEAVKNLYIKEQIMELVQEVQAGQSLSQAMQGSRSRLFAQDLVLLVTVGQETGALTAMLERATDIYQKQVQRAISQYTTLLQPALMLVLGLLVAGLIFAVYMPLFNLAELV